MATIYGTDWHSFSAWGNASHTIDVNIAPAWIAAEVCLRGTSGEGTSITGIKEYRRRLSSGADKVHNFGFWGYWKPMIYDYVSSITFAIATTSDQKAWMVGRMDYWG